CEPDNPRTDYDYIRIHEVKFKFISLSTSSFLANSIILRKLPTRSFNTNAWTLANSCNCFFAVRVPTRAYEGMRIRIPAIMMTQARTKYQNVRCFRRNCNLL